MSGSDSCRDLPAPPVISYAVDAGPHRMESTVSVVFIAPAAIFALLFEQERSSSDHQRIGVGEAAAREAVDDLAVGICLALPDRPWQARPEKRALSSQQRRRQPHAVVVVEGIDDVRHGIDGVSIAA